MTSRAIVAAGVLVAVAGSAVTAVAVTRRSSGMPAELETQLHMLATRIDHDANAVRTAVLDRAGALGGLEHIQLVIGTDPSTASDMFGRGELGFTAQPGEVIELGNVPRHGQDEPKFSERTVLLVEPSAARASRADVFLLGASESDLDGCAGTVPRPCEAIVYTTVYQMDPSFNAENLVGYVLVARRFDLKAANARLAAAGDAQCGEEGSPPTGWLALATAPASGFSCFARVPDAEPMTLPIGLGIGVILAGLCVAVAGRRRETWA